MALIHKLSITNVAGEKILSTRQLVQKRIEYIKYSQSVPDEDIPLSYVGLPEIHAEKDISYVNRSADVKENSTRPTYFAEVTATTTKTVSSDLDNLLITDQVITDSAGNVTPLFKKHSLPENTSTVSIRQVTHNGSTDVSTGLYKTSSSVSEIYANFENWFDELTGRYRLYYIQSIDSSGNVVSEVWNPKQIYTEATFDDIDFDTATVKEGVTAYTKDERNGRFHYTLPVYGIYYIKDSPQTRINPTPPVLTQAEDPWQFGVTVGQFTRALDGVNYTYYPEEFDLQIFTPYGPLKQVGYEQALKVSNNVLKLQREMLRIDTDENIHFSIIIQDKTTGVVEYVLTTDTTLEGTKYGATDIEYNSTAISSWDSQESFVVLDGVTIEDRHDLRAAYYYEEREYTYTVVNFNPIQYPDILNKMTVLYIVPDVKGTDEASLYHLFVRDNKIIYISQTGGTFVPNLSPLNSDGSINTNSVIGLNYAAEGIYGASFEDKYPEYLILAEINVLETARPEPLEV